MKKSKELFRNFRISIINIKQRPYRIVCALCCFVLVLMQPILYHSIALSPDEGYFMFMGNSILHGAIPYINYADNKPPGIWYLIALVFQVFGKSMYAARWTLYITNGLSAFVVYLLGKELRNAKIGIIAIVFFLVGILVPAFQGYNVLTEPFLTFFSLLGLLFFIKGRGRKLSLITCGVAISVATLFKQTGLLLFIALIIFYLCNFWIPTNRNKNYMVSSVKSTFLLLCGFFIPILVVVSYFWGVGALGQLVDYMILGLKGYGSQFAGILNLGYQFATFSIVWVLSCAALLTIGYKFIKKRSDWETLVSIWLLLTLCPLLSRQFGHYYIQILPPACLLASVCLVNIFPGSLQIKEILKQRKTKLFFTQACVVFLVIACFGISCRGYNFTMDNNTASLQYEIQTADYIQSHTASNDTILVYPYQPSIYFLSDRDPCVKVLILQSEEVDEEAQLDLLQQIIKNNPKYVVMQTQADGTIVYSGLQSIYGYLVSNFKEVKSIGNFDIYINDSSE